jgi:hypothetical protein
MIILTLGSFLFFGCQTDPEKTTNRAEQKLKQSEQKVDRIDKSLNRTP